MRLLILVGLCLVTLLGLAAEAGAADKKRKAQRHAVRPPVSTGAPRPDQYREMLADKIPIGTAAWWDQMQREGRLGGEIP
jgi:hypothetical protein